MKARLVPTIILLSLLVASAAGAYTLDYDYVQGANSTTYSYTFAPDMDVVGFHVYSPVLPGLIDTNSGWASNGWSFSVDSDPYTGGCDIYWSGSALTPGQTLMLSFATTAATETVTDWAAGDDVTTNWALDVDMGPDWGGVWTLFQTESVPTPSGLATTETPEPGTMAALLAGLAGLVGLKRRK